MPCLASSVKGRSPLAVFQEYVESVYLFAKGLSLFPLLFQLQSICSVSLEPYHIQTVGLSKRVRSHSYSPPSDLRQYISGRRFCPGRKNLGSGLL